MTARSRPVPREIETCWLRLLAMVVMGFAMPGAGMSDATDMNVWIAINPVTWFKVMARLGWPYFVAALLCAVIAISQANAQKLLLPFLPGWVGLIAFYFI